MKQCADYEHKQTVLTRGPAARPARAHLTLRIKESRKQRDSLNNNTQPQPTRPGVVIAGLCQIIKSPLTNCLST